MGDLPEVRLTGLGLTQEVPGQVDKIPPFDPRTGDHYWILPIVHHIVDPARWYAPNGDGPGLLDMESIVMVTGVGCYYCEQPWSALLASRRCRYRP